MAMNAKTHFGDLNVRLLRSYQRHLVADGYRPLSVQTYAASVRSLLRWAAPRDATSLRRADIEEWMVGLRTEGKRTLTVWDYWRNVRAFYDWLVEEEEIDTNPMQKMRAPATEETEKDVASAEEMLSVLAYLEKHRRWRDYAIIAILYDTGIRAGELAAARLKDLDDEHGILLLPVTKGKVSRMVRLSPVALRALDRYHRRTTTEMLVAGTRGPLSGRSIWKIVRNAFAAADIEKPVGPHDLRHTSASHVAAARTLSETEAMTLYGWKNPDMWRHYTRQVQQEAALKAHESASPLTRLLAKGSPGSKR